MHFIVHWMDTYGYVILVLLLVLEMLALPLPGEMLMSYVGLQVFHGTFSWPLSILLAWIGTCTGVTGAYWIGNRLGHPFFEKYGSRIHMGPDRLNQVSEWFAKFGNKLLVFAYFIPGVRHITGYFAGVTRIPFRSYAVYAYAGALLWTGTFISLGRLLGPEWEHFHRAATRYLIIGGCIALAAMIIVYAYRKYRRQIFDTAADLLGRGAASLHSLRKLRLLVTTACVVFLTFFALMVRLIEDFFSHEFTRFDRVTSYIIHELFDERWAAWMRGFAFLASMQVLVPIVAVSAAWILLRSRERRIELGFTVVLVIGGELWEEGLRRLFHRLDTGTAGFAFPSEQTFITLIYIGFAAYLLVRHRTAAWLRTAAFLLVIAVSLLVGLSRIYFGIQFPSDVAAGYVFGGVWLSLNIVLMEIFRFIKRSKGGNES
ncbi:hypothetical protein PAECIP111802_00041 [Paenibacillus allorhizosphaerae]|uniref:Phosphatase PAP2 family protein n=2 Tax=Paenibacillus allorhizosphaerae TaxID=2849866 RepID=A0ABM8V9R2_9BACL|nr:hypothetical protein PAECIP111802_00041 [Paenibacillus allorhizosphaerae]